MSSAERSVASPSPFELREEFAARARSVGAEVVITVSRDLVDVLRRHIGPLGAGGIGVGSELVELLRGLDRTVQTDEDWPAVAITRGVCGIAANGSVVLADRRHDDRSLALLCRRHIVCLPPCIVATPAGVVPRLQVWIESRERPYVSFVTGPSRTSDIERVLTIGVHGPAELVVVLVEDWEDIDA